MMLYWQVVGTPPIGLRMRNVILPEGRVTWRDMVLMEAALLITMLEGTITLWAAVAVLPC